MSRFTASITIPAVTHLHYFLCTLTNMDETEILGSFMVTPILRRKQPGVTYDYPIKRCHPRVKILLQAILQSWQQL